MIFLPDGTRHMADPIRKIQDGVQHAWSFIGAVTTVTAPLSAAQDANKPGGIQANDLLFVTIFSATIIGAPVGWVSLGGSPNLRSHWRIGTGDSNDDYALPVGVNADTGRQVIYSVFRSPGEVPNPIATSGIDSLVAVNAAMIIANMGVDQPLIIEPILIVSTMRSGTIPTQVPIFSGVPSPWKLPISPIYTSWGGANDRYNYLGTVYQLEDTGASKPASTYTWAQFEGSAGLAQSDSKGHRWDKL